MMLSSFQRILCKKYRNFSLIDTSHVITSLLISTTGNSTFNSGSNIQFTPMRRTSSSSSPAPTLESSQSGMYTTESTEKTTEKTANVDVAEGSEIKDNDAEEHNKDKEMYYKDRTNYRNKKMYHKDRKSRRDNEADFYENLNRKKTSTLAPVLECFHRACDENLYSLAVSMKNILKKNSAIESSHYIQLIKVCLKNEKIDEVFNLLDEIKKVGRTPSRFLYFTTIKGLCDVNRIDLALKLMRTDSIVWDHVIYTVFIVAYCSMGQMNEAWEMYKKAESHPEFESSVSLTMVRSFCQHGFLDEGIKFLSCIEKNSYSTANFTYLIECLKSYERYDDVLNLFQLMKEKHIEPKEKTYSVVLWSFFHLNRFDDIINFLEQFGENWKVSYITLNQLVYQIFSRGEYQCANDIIDIMQKRGMQIDLIQIRSMLFCLCKHHRCDDAIKMLFEMNGKYGVEPDVSIFELLLKHLGDICTIDQLKTLQIEFERCNLEYNEEICALFIKAYCRNGEITMAIDYLQNMREVGSIPTAKIYSAMLYELNRVENVQFLEKDIVEIARQMEQDQILMTEQLENTINKFCFAHPSLSMYFVPFLEVQY